MDITYVKGLFLLFLIVSGNFIGNTLSCQIQELFTYSMAVKEMLVFFVQLILEGSGHALEVFALLTAIALFIINKLGKKKIK